VTSDSGMITSTSAAATAHTAIGWADSAISPTVNTTPNTIELMYTLAGDLNLDRAVNITDINALVPHYNSAGSWTGGDVNYDGQVNITDVNALVPNYNTSLGSQVQSANLLAIAAVSSNTAEPPTPASEPLTPTASASILFSEKAIQPRHRRLSLEGRYR